MQWPEMERERKGFMGIVFPSRIDDSILGRVEDMLRAFETEAFFSAIASALTIPDICGKYLFPNESACRERYGKWFDRYISSNYVIGSNTTEAKEEIYFCGEDCYRLRCVFLHEGITDLHKDYKQTTYNLAQFRLFGKTITSGVDFIGELSEETIEGRRLHFRQVGLNLAKFIQCIAAGSQQFVDQYPEANSLDPPSVPIKTFYSPLLDFREVMKNGGATDFYRSRPY